MKIDLTLLDKYVADKLITRRQHPDAPLLIFNYTPVCQFSRNWDEITMMCRGLITDLDGNIVARPFKKFFNLEEHQGEIPNEPFTVHEKLDGSLGILYWIGNQPYLATRGSFMSDQAIEGTKILRERYGEYLAELDRDYTYLFEIIYPENRIVVDYGHSRDTILLAKVWIEEGHEASVEEYRGKFNVTKFYDGVSDLAALRELENSDDEGFVVTFTGGLKLKLKFKEYVRLHRLLTNISNKSIWEVLKNGDSFDELLYRVPDEFYKWVKTTRLNLTALHEEYMHKARMACDRVQHLDTRKEMAEVLSVEQPIIRALAFAILDGKESRAEEIAWKALKPDYEKPFKQDLDK